MTEKKIIRALYNRYIGQAQHKFAIHNSTGILPRSGEADFVTVNKGGFVSEIEVKVSKADFKRDFKKVRKHKYLGEAHLHVSISNPWLCMPNYFFFAVPEGMIKKEEVPEKYGLLYVKDGEVRVIKKPKRLHDMKVSPKKIEEFAHLLSYRVMNLI